MSILMAWHLLFQCPSSMGYVNSVIENAVVSLYSTYATKMNMQHI